MNLIGSNKLKNKIVAFEKEDCVNNICSKKCPVDLPGESYLYLNYEHMVTSYFIYAKGTSYGDIFKKRNYQTNTDDCYPVATYRDYQEVMKILNLPYTNPKIVKGIEENEGQGKISPCGLKSALYNYLGKFSLKTVPNEGSESSEVPIDSSNVINKKYHSYIEKSDNDFLDVSDGRFFGWYMPQMPAFGTVLFQGRVTDLSGEYNFVFDLNNVFFDKDHPPKIQLTQVPDGIWSHFNNFVFGIFMISYSVLSIIALVAYFYFKNKQKKEFLELHNAMRD